MGMPSFIAEHCHATTVTPSHCIHVGPALYLETDSTADHLWSIYLPILLPARLALTKYADFLVRSSLCPSDLPQHGA